MSKKQRGSRNAVRVRLIANTPPHGTEPSLSSIHAKWPARLRTALDGTLCFSDRWRGGQIIMKAHSADGRTILELTANRGVLLEASLQLALSDSKDLEMVKVGCWALLYLKALFADWPGLPEWTQAAFQCATQSGQPVQKQLNGYHVVCWHDPDANVLDFQVIRS